MVINFSPEYLLSYKSRTSRAVIFVSKGIDSTEMMPLNHGATAGTKATLIAPLALGASWERCLPASRSWIWSVNAYGRMPPERFSGVTLATVVGRLSAAGGPATVPAPLYPETPKIVGHACGLICWMSGATSNCVDVA